MTGILLVKGRPGWVRCLLAELAELPQKKKESLQRFFWAQDNEANYKTRGKLDVLAALFTNNNPGVGASRVC